MADGNTERLPFLDYPFSELDKRGSFSSKHDGYELSVRFRAECNIRLVFYQIEKYFGSGLAARILGFADIFICLSGDKPRTWLIGCDFL